MDAVLVELVIQIPLIRVSSGFASRLVVQIPLSNRVKRPRPAPPRAASPRRPRQPRSITAPGRANRAASPRRPRQPAASPRPAPPTAQHRRAGSANPQHRRARPRPAAPGCARLCQSAPVLAPPSQPILLRDPALSYQSSRARRFGYHAGIILL